MERKNKIELICDSCGQSAYFEFNYNASYAMCMYCMRAYKGGYEELARLNANKKSNLIMDRADTVK